MIGNEKQKEARYGARFPPRHGAGGHEGLNDYPLFIDVAPRLPLGARRF